MAAPLPVYLAGPDVFVDGAAEIGRAKQAICAQHGLEGRFPLDVALPDDVAARPPTEQAQLLFDGCCAMLRGCVAGIANLTPFRGASADVGTAFELGWLAATGTPVFAYTSHPDPYPARVPDDGHHVEPFGLADNLMLVGAVAAHGAPVVVRPATGEHDPLAAMEAFEACVVLAASRLGGWRDLGG